MARFSGLFFVLASILFPVFLSAQELNCRVTINAQRVRQTEPRVFQTLETSIFEFLNGRRWTSDLFKPEERIECSIQMNIMEELGSNKFKATVSIQASRPAFNSSYNTVLLNYADKDWIFEYVEFQPLEFNENTFINNLTSMLGFYAFLIIGLDYDSFGQKGGEPYFLKAQQVMNNVPTGLGGDAPGWRPFEGQSNRYWMIENILNPRYEPIRRVYYQYHLQGMDLMYDNVKTGRQVITNSLKTMAPIAEANPNAMYLRMFFNAKSDELINIYSGASPAEKTEAVQLLYKLDPSNSNKYGQILKAK